MASSLPPWLDREGQALECAEKLRVLTENEAEFLQVLSDVWEDALVMEVAPEMMRKRLETLLRRFVDDQVPTDWKADREAGTETAVKEDSKKG
ncbi:hypothetical protein [Oecophyllibacter saccharovorans]|uniref:hypothetical protein n=1 Tax=Oecophyllibacter saccharovorans TaxID=2558360 RepID=UPI0018837F3B|nr:hypothetical protein [Oecophyllibacter saccharovorans]